MSASPSRRVGLVVQFDIRTVEAVDGVGGGSGNGSSGGIIMGTGRGLSFSCRDTGAVAVTAQIAGGYAIFARGAISVTISCQACVSPSGRSQLIKWSQSYSSTICSVVMPALSTYAMTMRGRDDAVAGGGDDTLR